MKIPGTLAAHRGRRVVNFVTGAALLVALTIVAVPGGFSTGTPAVRVAADAAKNSSGSSSSGGAVGATDGSKSTSPSASLASGITTPAKPVAMSTYPVSRYATAAAKLPSSMTTALAQNPGITGAEYLADSAAAIQGVKVVTALKSAGVAVLGSSMSGTRLTVNVASSKDVAAVKAVGATAVVGAPKKPHFSTATIHTVSTVNTYGGLGYYYVSNGSGWRCSIGFNGYSSTGTTEYATAGHCETAIPSGSDAYLLSQPAPQLRVGDNALEVYENPLGAPVAGQFGNGIDYGVISSTGSGFTPQPSLVTWGDNNGSTPSTGAPTSSTPLSITGETQGIVGATMCKSGSTTGWTCGVIEAVDYPAQVEDDSGDLHQVNSIVATTCLQGGDSGGGAVIGSEAVGIDSASQFPNATAPTSANACANPGSDPSAAITSGDLDADPGYVSFFFPMESAAGADSVQGQQGANWQLALAVSTPVVASASTWTRTTSQSLSGTLANTSSTSTVSLYLDGSTTATSTISAASGSWSFPLASIPLGTHTYSIVAKSGFSVGTAATGSFHLVVAVPIDLDGGVGDFNSDGHTDLIARDAAGNLWLYPGNGASALSARVELAVGSAGWSSATAIVPAGDFNGDGKPDVILRDSAGNLWLYPGNGANGFGARIEIATGWQGMTAIQNVGDFTGDGHVDLVARDSSGNLWLYPGNGTGGFGTRIQIPGNWSSMSAIVGAGDFTGDGKPDILMRDSSGTLWMYPNNGSDGFGTPVSLGSGWNGLTLAAAGDFNGDDYADLVARDSSGNLWLYPGSAAGFGQRVLLGTGFAGDTIAGDGSSIVGTSATPANLQAGIDFTGDDNRDLIVRDSTGTLRLFEGNGAGGFSATIPLGGTWQGLTDITPVGDFNGDGHADVIARDSSGNLWLYPGNGSNGFGARTLIAVGWQGMTAVQSVGDVDGDGHTDLLARDASGNLWLYPGNGTGGLDTRVLMASGWQAMTAIVGVGDFNGDGHPDVLARDSSGTLWLYPGNSSDGFGPRVSLGGGWNGYTFVGVGDFNGDGHTDLLARDATGVLWLFEGNGSNGWLGHVSLGSSFAGMTLGGASPQ